ncbi:MAG: hypothetical protein ACE5RJ_03320 [Nitrosopumilaceae archaeon]
MTDLWVEDKITDNNFREIMTFLIDKEIMTIPLIQELQDEIIQLENENELLRAELNNSKIQVKVESSALPSTGITVKTNKSSYIKGDIISSSGIIKNHMQGIPVLFSMYDPRDNLLAVYQVAPNEKGYFFIDTSTKNPLWETTGTYSAIVSYGATSDRITFYFDAEQTNEILEN